MTINLKQTGAGYYEPVSEADKHLMQHIINEDLDALNIVGLDKARYIAAAHNWEIVII